MIGRRNSDRVIEFIAFQSAGFLSFGIVMLALLVMLDTFYVRPPFDVLDSRAEISVVSGVKQLSEMRDLYGKSIEHISTHRHLVSKQTSEIIYLNDSTINIVPGPMMVHRTYLLPVSAAGDWCEKSTVRWKPVFSLIEHSINLPDLCFEVPK